MQAVSYLAPALAPLAIKLIDKYIFDDQPPAPVPQIIQIPASPLCACRCGQQSGEYDSTSQTCSTCTGTSMLSDRSSNKHLSAKTCTRSSSTSDAYQKENRKSSRSARISSDSTDVRSEKKSSKHSVNENTLAILAVRLKKEISHQNKGKKISRDSKSLGIEKSSTKLKVERSGPASSSPGSRKCTKSTRETKPNCSVAII